MRRRGFTLMELLVTLALVLLLAGLCVPFVAAAIEKARAAQCHAELGRLEAALELYRGDFKKYPPVRVSCNSREREHWCELPAELVEEGYLARGNKEGVSSLLEDPFNPGHTYKYATPGPYYLNGDLQPDGFAMYVPDDFPHSRSAQGRYYDTAMAPVGWAVWSLGPRQSTAKALSSRAPLSAQTWYHQPGDQGVLARIKPRDGASYPTR